MKLDAYDKKILFALDSNSRMTYVQIGKKANLSKDAVKNRINNYLKNGLLGGFYPLIDSSKLGYYSFRVYFSFRNTSLEDEEKILGYLINEKNVFYLIQVEGSFDIGFGYFVKTISKFKNFINKFKQKFSCIKIIQEGIFLNLYHFDRNYFTKNKRLQKQKEILQEPKGINFDEIDNNLLRLLSKNARMQIIEMAKELNLTSKAVIYRIRNLEKKEIILGYKPKINLENFGYSMYKLDIFLKNKSTKEKIKKFVFQLPNIIHSEEVFGGSDLEFDIECKDYEEYKKIINSIKKEHGRDILEIKHYRTIKIYKTKYFPEE